MYKLFVSCEHASNHVPEQLTKLLRDQKSLLQSHRAYDIGAIDAAQQISKMAVEECVAGTCTRLAIDLNRSDTNPRRFSEYSKKLDSATLANLEIQWYRPYRDYVRNRITQIIESGYNVLHLSVHTFTPVLNGVTRNADLGLLYDPSRQPERVIASNLKNTMFKINSNLRTRFNYPYRGVSDGITSWLRKHFSETKYSGLEIEFNQDILNNRSMWDKCLRDFTTALAQQGE
ncbi:MAG TPA: N-formylglutamate amidohydrolase [Chitinispirillaceae bacterium]|nr:N-formylglutamate amidohydrolase [Chitinispirillaceae bacterium]